MILFLSLSHGLMASIAFSDKLIAILDVIIIDFPNHFLFASFAPLHCIKLFFTFEFT